MDKEAEECYKLLKCYKYHINKQQYLTLKGQIQAKDYNGFRTGIFTIAKRKAMNPKRKT